VTEPRPTVTLTMEIGDLRDLFMAGNHSAGGIAADADPLCLALDIIEHAARSCTLCMTRSTGKIAARKRSRFTPGDFLGNSRPASRSCTRSTKRCIVSLSKRKPRTIDGGAFDEHRFVHESLIEICDLLGEGLASEATRQQTGDSSALSEINVLVWKLRWELDMTGGHAVALADVESEAAE
jgi:hypothetical protein